MTRCAHTGLSIPECSCRACLITLVETHAPRPATDAGARTAPADSAQSGADARLRAA
ncbi:MAG TPA: hypothetical protein VF087_12870 [Solirubrobacteraceae bacterium]